MAKHAQTPTSPPRTSGRRGKAALALVSAGALAAGLVAALAPSANADAPTDTSNLIADGDFATPAVSGNFTTYSSGNTFGAWTVDSGDVDLSSQSQWGAPAGDPAATQTVDLSGTGPGSISQHITMPQGSTYHVSYQYAGNPQGGPAVKTGWVKVSFGSGGASAQLKFDTTGHSTSDMGWKSGGFYSRALGTDATITAYSDTAGAYGPVITDLSVTIVPPPVFSPTSDVVVPATSPAGAEVFAIRPSASDPNDGGAPLSVHCTPESGSEFPIGTTPVTCTTRATTAPFLTASTTFNVTVKPIVGECRGRPGMLLNQSRGTANLATSPCKADVESTLNTAIITTPAIPLLHIPAQGVSVGLGQGETSLVPGGTAATAEVANVDINLLGISLQVDGVRASASAVQAGSCGAATLSGSSYIAKLTLNGKSYTIGDKSLTIPLPLGLGGLYLNQTVTSGNTVTHRALYLNLPGTGLDIILGEAVAGASCG